RRVFAAATAAHRVWPVRQEPEARPNAIPEIMNRGFGAPAPSRRPGWRRGELASWHERAAFRTRQSRRHPPRWRNRCSSSDARVPHAEGPAGPRIRRAGRGSRDRRRHRRARGVEGGRAAGPEVARGIHGGGVRRLPVRIVWSEIAQATFVRFMANQAGMMTVNRAVEALADDPAPPGAFVRGAYRRLRVGPYRVLYEVEGNLITIVRIDRV